MPDLCVAGCEKNYSIEDFKKNEKLCEEWIPKWMWKKPSKIESLKKSENVEKAQGELRKESFQNDLKKYHNNDDKQKAKNNRKTNKTIIKS
ncbi:EexN family lipoprotein [Bartonella heixiaziensis]|uniref:EexN family lipoprotein n=1 Tax=Bartonella heixiaziensis TaxID=1461000 RepID=UPI003D23DECB